MLIEKRFLKYVSFDTQSDESSTTSPSTEKQFDLADFLSEEMQILGVDEVERTDQGIVYGKIYSNTDEPMKAIGFIMIIWVLKNGLLENGKRIRS